MSLRLTISVGNIRVVISLLESCQRFWSGGTNKAVVRIGVFMCVAGNFNKCGQKSQDRSI